MARTRKVSKIETKSYNVRSSVLLHFLALNRPLILRQTYGTLYMKKNHKTLSFLGKCMLIGSLVWIQSCSKDDEVPQNIDSQITFSNITPAMPVWNNVPISLEASDDMGIASVEVLVD